MSRPGPSPSRVAGFRRRLLVAMMLVISGCTALALYFAQRNLEANVEHDLQRQFQAELTALHNIQETRQAAMLERCRALVRRPRIHAALEDNALDLLYPSAEDELHAVAERIAASRRRRAMVKAGVTVRDVLASAAERKR